MDTLTIAQRSQRMARIRSKDTKPEKAVRSLLHGLGYRFRLHEPGLSGSPDLVLAGRRKVVFVHGCFWHSHARCKIANVPKSRTAYWLEKFRRNKERDRDNEDNLRRTGWDVLVVWECQVQDKEALTERLTAFLGPPKQASLK